MAMLAKFGGAKTALGGRFWSLDDLKDGMDLKNMEGLTAASGGCAVRRLATLRIRTTSMGQGVLAQKVTQETLLGLALKRNVLALAK